MCTSTIPANSCTFIFIFFWTARLVQNPIDASKLKPSEIFSYSLGMIYVTESVLLNAASDPVLWTL